MGGVWEGGGPGGLQFCSPLLTEHLTWCARGMDLKVIILHRDTGRSQSCWGGGSYSPDIGLRAPDLRRERSEGASRRKWFWWIGRTEEPQAGGCPSMENSASSLRAFPGLPGKPMLCSPAQETPRHPGTPPDPVYPQHLPFPRARTVPTGHHQEVLGAQRLGLRWGERRSAHF